MTQLVKIIVGYSVWLDLAPHVDKDKHESSWQEDFKDTSKWRAFPIDPVFAHQSFVVAEATH